MSVDSASSIITYIAWKQMTMTFEGAKQGVDSVQEAVSRESKEYVLAYHEAGICHFGS